MNTRDADIGSGTSRLPRGTGIATLMGFVGEALRIAERSIGPLLDLVIRVRLAQVFFVSGVLKASDWEHAIFLASHEYPVSWMDPVTAAYLGAAIEVLGSVCLAAGLATRLAAAAMLALSLVIQFNYVVLDTNVPVRLVRGARRRSVVPGSCPEPRDRRYGLALREHRHARERLGAPLPLAPLPVYSCIALTAPGA